MAFGSEHQNVGLDTHALQFFHRMLRGFGFEFVCGFQIRHVGQVYAYGASSQFPAQLSDSLHERSALDVADGAAHFRDDEVQILVRLIFAEHAALDLVGNVRHDLDGLAQIVAVALAVDDSFVDAARSDGVVAGGVDACETLVMPEVEVCFHSVSRDVTFAVFVGVECAGVDVDVGIEFLDSYFVAARLQQFADACGDNSFS